MSKIELITDPRIFGPGLWHSIHTQGWYAKSDEEKKAFLKFMENTRDTMQCLSCKEHMQNYMEQHPISSYWNQDYGMFKWSFEFHNAVSERINSTIRDQQKKKPILSWMTAYNLYSRAVVSYCDTDCGHEGQRGGGGMEDNVPITYKGGMGTDIGVTMAPSPSSPVLVTLPFASSRAIATSHGRITYPRA